MVKIIKNHNVLIKAIINLWKVTDCYTLSVNERPGFDGFRVLL